MLNTVNLLAILSFGLSYLVGSLSSAVLLCRAYGLADPRTCGSKNPGATNVMRVAGKKVAALVLLCDVIKGVLPVATAVLLQLPDFIIKLAGFAVFLGHLYPVLFDFKGGKGVATALGVMLVLAWPLALSLLALWIVVFTILKISSIAALSCIVAAPLFSYLFLNEELLILITGMSLLMLFRHQGNIKRLIAGKEK